MRIEENRIGCCASDLRSEGISRRISQDIPEHVTIPTTVVVGLTLLAVGIFFGPALLSLSSGGRDYLSRAAQQKFAG